MQVDTVAMARAANMIGVAAEHLEAMMTKMRNDVNDMLAGWGGKGARAHADLHQRYEADVQAITRNLYEMQVALQETHGVYVTQENEQSQDHNTMRSRIV